MYKFDTFKQKIDDVNSHYERIFNSRLHNLVELLKRKMPPASPNEVQNEIDKLRSKHPKGCKKYKDALDYLTNNFPGLGQASAKSQMTIAIGITTSTYAPGKWYQTKDRDGKFHNYIMQKKGNSCGCACVKILKTAWFPGARDMSEDVIQNQIALKESGAENTGQSLFDNLTTAAHNWETTPDNPAAFEYALKCSPFAIKSAQVSSRTYDEFFKKLQAATPNKPAMAGWLWASGGGHMTVCKGPTGDGNHLIILDPWNGIQYVPNDKVGFRTYQPVDESGSVTGNGTIGDVISTA